MPMSTSARRMFRAIAGLSGTTALLVGVATGASAHVNVSPGQAPAGSYTLLTFSVPHGCDGSATTEVAIDIPEEIPTVTPTVNPDWDVQKFAADGEEVEAGPAARVVYTARTPLPAHLRDTFELSVRLPDDAGQTLAFPVAQACEEGEVAWDEVPEDGADPHELEYPAPSVTVTEPAGDGGNGASAADEAQDEDGDDAGSDDAGVTAASMAGVGAGVAGMVLGAAALLAVRRSSRANR